MRTCSLLLLFIAGSFFQLLQGQDVRITGSGNGYSGAELRIFRQSDPVSKSLYPVARIRCDQEGRFSCDITANGAETIFINTGIFSFCLYIASGSSYELKLPDLVLKTAEEEQNTFFIPLKVIPEVVNSSDDINNLLKRFDAEYDPIFNRVADRVMYSVKLDEIPSLIEKLNNLSAIPGATGFYKDFVTFRLIMLNLVARGEYPGRVEDSILINRKFNPSNPAYVDLIEQMFAGYFKDLTAGDLRESFKKAVASSSSEDLKNVISNDGKASNPELQEFIILLNLYAAYYDESIPAGNVLDIIKSIGKNGASQYLRDLAVKIRDRLLMLSVSSTPPEINLQDKEGKLYTLKDFSGKYLLITFAHSDNSFSVAEYGIMNTWISRYREKLQVVTILRDADFKKAVSKMAGYGFSWIMLDGSSSDMLEYQYNVKMYPSFLMVDPGGLIMMKHCPFPSENLEDVIDKITAEREK